jgi:hypothetical protein
MDVTNWVHPDTLEKPAERGTTQTFGTMFSRELLFKILREPLVHFLFFGALLFLYFQWRGGGYGVASNHIVITPGQIEHLAVGYARTWQKTPTEAELKGLIDEYVKDEIATREAIAMGLDRDDTIIRRRLRQKLEFLAEETIQQAPPTEADLKAWMTRHPEAFHSEPQVAFQQVYVNTSRRGQTAKSEAEKLLATLRAAGPNASIYALGDQTMLPGQQGLAPLFDTARTFGDDFAQALMRCNVGQWSGPVESSFGLHLVLVKQKVFEARQDLTAIRPQVEREVMLERKNKELQNLYDKLLNKYTVKIEQPATAPSGTMVK